ncbi:hypothetical protein F5I97DRAFT_1938667 [Phlebopus sp. FC_14]|nr:hypothetical protein F5I97DRAFT_1938667 [Phlebopus sp. FC_14]
MAVLAPSDWHPPRDHTMDAPANPAIPRQRSSPPNDHAPSLHPQQSQQHSQQSQQPYPYPVQQQPHGAWTPSVSAPPFYPSFYQNQHQHQQHPPPHQPYPLHPVQQQNPYFDPAANAQLAQWAYQQMMFNAQAQMGQHSPINVSPQRSAPSSAPASPAEYFNPNQLFNPFPSGTPPPHQQHHHHHPHAPGYTQRTASADTPRNNYDGFHPYRRPPNNQPTRSQGQEPDWRPGGTFQPPYARGDASASTRARTGSGSSNTSASANASANRPSAHPHPHHRTTSSSSTASSGAPPRPSGSTSNSSTSSPSSSHASHSHHSSHSNPKARPARSTYTSPTHSPAEKRMSRDDSDLAAMLESSAMGLGSGGLKAQALQEEDEDAPAPGSGSGSHTKSTPTSAVNGSPADALSPTDTTDAASTITAGTVGTAAAAAASSGQGNKKKSRAASLFNSRLNASTDNISLSSTMSSASVVIRKIGSIGKLARRNSLADRDGKDESGEGKKSKKKKDAKGSVVEPSLDRGSSSSGGDWSDASMSGLSPAAKLARQHTLKSNAEAAAKAKAQAEAQAQAQAQATAQAHKGGVNGNGEGDGGVEDGMRVHVEDDSDSGSENGQGHGAGGAQRQSFISEGWEDDEPWQEEEDEDVTVRMNNPPLGVEDEEVVEWARSIRRSLERGRPPMRGILKGAENYNQDVFITDPTMNPASNRIRSNSYNSHPGSTSELGPLARIPSPNPDHIDGLHRHPSHSSTHGGNIPSLPPLSFGASSDSSPSSDAESGRSSPHHAPLFTLPNSSAPALSTIPTAPMTLPHRAPSGTKRLVFASNLSVYDTFSSAVYDRRSEPATWSRLTPALAQRIKEELNSYKMEEMEVHACSRMHTQFFI